MRRGDEAGIRETQKKENHKTQGRPENPDREPKNPKERRGKRDEAAR
jgi:hypothetical protein